MRCHCGQQRCQRKPQSPVAWDQEKSGMAGMVVPSIRAIQSAQQASSVSHLLPILALVQLHEGGLHEPSTCCCRQGAACARAWNPR